MSHASHLAKNKRKIQWERIFSLIYAPWPIWMGSLHIEFGDGDDDGDAFFVFDNLEEALGNMLNGHRGRSICHCS